MRSCFGGGKYFIIAGVSEAIVIRKSDSSIIRAKRTYLHYIRPLIVSGDLYHMGK